MSDVGVAFDDAVVIHGFKGGGCQRHPVRVHCWVQCCEASCGPDIDLRGGEVGASESNDRDVLPQAQPQGGLDVLSGIEIIERQIRVDLIEDHAVKPRYRVLAEELCSIA